MGVLKPDDYNEYRVDITPEQIAELRRVWSSKPYAYWDTLKFMFPTAKKSPDICRAITMQVWEGTHYYGIFWR